METHGFLLDFTNNMSAPAFVGVLLSIIKEEDVFAQVSGWLFFFQTLIFFVVLFITRASEYRSALYVSVMPELTHYASIVALTVMPILIIAYNIVGYFYLIKDVTNIYPFMVYTSFV